MIEKIVARGHKNILATHKTTFEITQEQEISTRADCIIAVNANIAAMDLKEDFKRQAKKTDAIIEVLIEVGGLVEHITGKGSPQLTLSHSTDLVGRKSAFISDRTFLINSDKAAIDLDRRLVEQLKKPDTEIIITLKVK
ncbi:DUF371 domain-containing protein [Candidatus Borrarchaeum sp.]|uniref:DUF371 domain-containing protein n=1 Tax=Candidatus Borrarchaeum sp. TaxID=2846742 RepID=UPI00257F5192|nr:DUF371 domain-containing protein [Candidatus Borrarchaeum sp.]